MNWVLNKYNFSGHPTLSIGKHTGYLSGISGYVGTSTGDKLIGLQVDELRKLEGADVNAIITEDYGIDVPIKPTLTVRQWYESFGVE